MDTFTFPPPPKSSLPASVIGVETLVEEAAQNERELRLINARKKLKNYRLKQAAAANSRDASSTGSFGLSANALNPTPNGALTSSAVPTPGNSRHKHTRTHSRNQSRSSLASILVSSEQVNIIDEVLAHQRRLSVTKPAYLHSRRDSLSRPITNPSLDSNATNPNRPSATFAPASIDTPESSSALPGYNSNRISLPPPVTGTTPTLVSTPWAGHDPSQPHQRTHSSSFVPHQHSHARRESKHMRKNSVSTRRESIEIMGGLGIIGVPSAPNGLCSVSNSENLGGARSINRGSWSGFPNPALPRADPYSPPCTASSHTFSSLGTRLSASGLGSGGAHLSNLDALVSAQSKKQASADVSPCTIHAEVEDSDGVETLTEATQGPMSVELARLAALSALEGKPSPQGRNAELEDLEKPLVTANSSCEGASNTSPSTVSDNMSMQSITPKVSTPAYLESHGTFQPQPFARADLQSDTGITPELSPNLDFGTSLSSRSERRMSWINGSVNNVGSNAAPVIGVSGINGLSWAGAGGLGLVRDLSRVEEEEENEDEDATMTISSVIPQPRAMETVTEEEEEEEEGTTSNAIPKPTPPKRHPHSLIFNTRSTSTTPTGSPSFGFGSRTLPPSSNARPLRALSLSLSQSPSAQVHASPAKLKPLALTSPKLSDTGPIFGIPTSGSSGAIPLSQFSATHCGSSSASASPSPSTSMLKFERPFPASSAVVGSQYNHYSAGSNSTNRSSLSSSVDSATCAPKPCVTRSRRSISYSKSPSPEPAKPPLTINTAPAKVGRFQALAQQSPTHSTSSAASKTSSQLDREQAHDGWKQSLVQSLQQKPGASFSRRENESVSSFQADGFGDLVMDGLEMEQLVQNDFSALEPEDERDAGQSILKAELLKSREETEKVRTESERVRVDLEKRIMKLQTQLDEMRKGSDAEDSSSLADGVEASQSIEETSPLVKRLGAEVDELKKLVDELESAKGELEEDVSGFKLRLKFLEGQMIQEKAKTAGYERDLKEKDRMIGELLRKRKNRSKTKTATTSSDTPSDDSGVSGSGLSGATEEEMEDENELKAAQVKLINEMRDQIFALASALEKERSEHVATKEALEAAAMQIEVNELDAEGPAMATLFSDEETSPEDTVPFESVVKQVRDSQIQSSSDESKRSSAHPEALDQLSPIVATVKAINCIREDSVDSTDSSPSEPLPKTPTVDRPQLHHRSESFIRHWSFPKGPVTHSVRSSEEDHCFFFRPNSIDITLPPVEPAKEVLETPPFLFSYLHHEEPEQIEQVKPAAYQKFTVSAMTHVPTPPHGLAMRKKDSFRSPLSSTSSIRSLYGARQDSIGSSTGKPGGASLTSRLSLQNLSSWVGNYVGGGNGMKMKEDLRLLQLERLERRLKERGVGNLDFRRCFEDSGDDDDEDEMKEEGVDSNSSSSSSISTNLRQRFFVI